MAQQIQIRRDTSSNWSSVNPILAQGEIGFETNTGKIKIGDGTTAWNSLNYFAGYNSLVSLTDVNLTSLASGNIILSNGSQVFVNQSLSSLINQLAFASLGSLAFVNQLSFTSLTNQPSLSSLAFQATLDYTSNQLLNKPSLGSLAPLNQLSFTSLTNQPSLSSLAFQSTVDYVTQVTSKPSLGSLAVLNSLTKSDVGLGNVTNDAQLKIASNLSDLNNIATARGNLSLGSLAVLNSVTAVLPSTASVDILYSNGIVNSSTVSTNLLSTNNILASTISIGNITSNNGAFNSTISTNILTGNTILASTISTGILSVATLNYPALASQYLKTDLSNTPLTGTTLNFNDTADKNININRTTTAATAGRALNITAGGAVSGGTNQAGGALKLSSGIATGNSSSDIEFLTASPGTSGTADRTPTTKMIVKGTGRVGIGTTNPSVQLQVVGNGIFSGDVSAANISGTNSGDQYMPVYGDGSDGYISLDGTTLYPNILSLAGSTYTLLRDIYCTTFNIVNGVTLETAGYRIFCITDCIVDGIIRNNGGNASGATAGTGATGGFFKAGTNGAAGLGTASAGANGTAVTNPTAATWVGGLGGRGGAGRASNTTFLGSGFVPGNVTPPANSDGGPRITSNFTTYLNKLVSAATPYQFTPSAGGGAGAKSATGTSAVSGGGGGGGGVVFIASPNISTFGTGVIQANGGDGGNASGTGGTFGGGGGGGGGVAAIIAKNCTITPQVNGGIGGTSVRLGTNPDSPVGTNVVNTTTTSTSISVTPTVCPSEYSLMMLSVNIQKTGGVSNCYITGITGYAMNWTLVTGSRVEYNSIASPTRAIEVWSGQVASLSADLPADRTITITFSEAPTNARIFIDEIFNTDVIDNGYPVTSNYQTNRSDSATTLTMTLPTAPAAADGVFTFVGRSGGTVAASTTGTIMGTSDTNSAGATMLGLGTTTNTMTHTTAAAVAGFSVELNKPTISQTRGSYGWNGRYIRLYG